MQVDVSSLLKLGAAVGGIYTCYLAYGVFQEQLYSLQPDGTTYSATAFVLFVQCMTNALIASIGQSLATTVFAPGEGEGGAPANAAPAQPAGHFWRILSTRSVILTAVVYVLAMYTSNEALGFVSYPTQALVKSCKMIPVLFGSILISGKRYGLLKWLCVILMTAGITIFQFGGKQKKSHGPSESPAGEGAEWIGMVLLGASLCLDGITGPLQEQMKRLNVTNFQQMLANNLWASALMLGIAIVLGQLDTSVAYLGAHPALISALVMFSLCSAFGQIFIFWTIRTFSALTLSTITTTRKFFTIVLSVFYYRHPLSTQQWVAVGVVFLGLTLEMFAKDDKHKKEEPAVVTPQESESSKIHPKGK